MLILTPLEVNCMRGFSKTQVVGFFLTGAAVGMAVALLYAPQSRVETRKQIRRVSKKTGPQLDDFQKDPLGEGSGGDQKGMEGFCGAKGKVPEGRKKMQKKNPT